MPTPSISPVNDCSIAQIIDSLTNLKSSAFINDAWLTSNNRYLYDIIEVYKKDLKATPFKTYHKFLKDYTASSSILHCTDGWTFLSRAINSLIEGDIPSAIFFTYYSELRALMSLFATNGISILNTKHVYINSDGKAVGFAGMGTHQQVRQTLNDYVNHPNKSELLLEWLRVDNTTLKDWIRATGSLATGYLTQDWLKKWSVDIDQVKFDHDSRNQVSYRPHKLKNALFDFTYNDNLLKIISFWKLCEPSGSNNFQLLDRHLLRLCLEEIFNLRPYRITSSNGSRNKESKTYKNSFRKFILKTAKGLKFKPNASLVNFLTRVEHPGDNEILTEANKPCFDKTLKKYNIIPMIARSLILSRISAGGCEYILRKSSVTKDDLEFWWSDLGNKYGFWEFGVLPDDFRDELWPTIEESINNLENFCLTNTIRNAKDLDKFSVNDVNRFKQLNQIPLWAIGL